MKGLNRVQLIGNVGHDPDVKYTDQGTARTTFSVAINPQWKDADGHVQEATEWVAVLAWGALAEIAGEHVTKGKRLYIEGRLHTRTWHDNAGYKRSRTEVIAQELILLGSRNEQADEEAHQADAGAAQQHARSPASEEENTPQNEHRRRHGDAQTTSGEPDWDAIGL